MSSQNGDRGVVIGTPLLLQENVLDSFRLENNEIDYQRLASAILNEVDTNRLILLDYMVTFFDNNDSHTSYQTLRLLSCLTGRFGGDFMSCLLYQKIFPGTTSEEFLDILSNKGELLLRTEDRLTNNYLYMLENLLGFQKGSMCDMSRK